MLFSARVISLLTTSSFSRGLYFRQLNVAKHLNDSENPSFNDNTISNNDYRLTFMKLGSSDKRVNADYSGRMKPSMINFATRI